MKTKSLAALILCAALCACSSAPAQTTAAEETTTTTSTITTTEAVTTTSAETTAEAKEYTDENGLVYSADGTTLLSCPSDLTELVIPEGVSFISADFLRCYSLKKIIFPASLRENYSFGYNLMHCNELTEIVIPDSNPYYTVSDDAVFNKDMTDLLFCFSQEEEYTVPEGVKNLETNSIKCENLKKITLPSSLETIDQAFCRCSSLETLVIPPNVKDMAISYVDLPNLKKLEITGNTMIYPGFAPSYDYGTGFPESLESIEISENNEHYTVIDDVIFSKDMKIIYRSLDTKEEYTVPDGVEMIDDFGFSDNTRLKRISFPGGLKKIGLYAFDGCTSLSTVSFSEGLEDIDGGAFYGCPLTGIIELPESLKHCENIFWTNAGVGMTFSPPDCSFSYKGNIYRADEIDYGFDGNVLSAE